MTAAAPSDTPDQQRAKVRRVLAICKDRPALFQRVVLGRTLWSKQVEICESIARYSTTVIPAGRAVGKSYLLAGIALWWLYTRPFSKVIITGPDHRLVSTVLFGEIQAALRSKTLRIPLGYDHISDGLASPQRLQVADGWECLGWASRSLTGLSGQHRAEQLVIVDEAAGVEDNVWQQISGSASKRVVVAGNPVAYDCRFRELHEIAQAGSASVNSVPISALEHPHAQLDESPIGAVNKTWLNEQRELYTEESVWWRSNILGLFPGKESVQYIPIDWVDRCVKPEILDDPRWQEHPGGTPWVGVDVAGGVGADKSAIAVRDDKQILDLWASEWHGVLDDAKYRLEPEVAARCERFGIGGDRVVYDKSNDGRNFGDALAAVGLPGAIGFFGESKGGKLYVNMRTACAARFKRRLNDKRPGYVPFRIDPAMPRWAALRQELLALRADLAYEEGIVKERLELKDALKARLRRSPDCMDALNMSYAYCDI